MNSKLQTNQNRESWVDVIKIFACILVVMGHFLQSMTSADIIPKTNLYIWFDKTIYLIRVQLFFICSGYLYQKYSHKTIGANGHFRNVLKKLIMLGIPYFVFSIVTWIIKRFLSGSVNKEVGSLFDALFIHPLSPYWYLFCLFFIFLITPVVKNKKTEIILLVIALAMKLFTIFGLNSNIYLIYKLCENEIWFILGMCLFLSNNNIPQKVSVILGIVLGIVFISLSVILFQTEAFSKLAFVLGVTGCASVIFICRPFNNVFSKSKIILFLSEYTMAIFLMHTIFAAGIRIILAKVGVSSAAIHVPIGVIISFVGPIIAYMIMKKIYLDVLVQPTKIVKKVVR